MQRMTETYICDECEGEFDKTVTDEEVWAEFDKNFPDATQEEKDDVGVLCNECNEEFKVWFAGLTDEQKQEMREEYFRE